MIRLDPSALPLWRDDGRVQFGAPELARTPFAGRWVDVVVAALAAGTTRPRCAVSRACTARRRRRRRPARRGGAGDRVEQATGADRSAGRRRSAGACRSGRPRCPPGAHERDPLGRTGRTPRADRRARGASGRPPRRPAARGRAAQRRRDAHPLTLDAGGATIGPVVVPAEPRAIACLDATRRRDDAQWPMIAAQLLGRPRPDVDVALAAEAGRAARFLLRGPIASTSRSLRLRAIRSGGPGRCIGRAKSATADLLKEARRRAFPAPSTRAQLTDSVRAARVTPT